MLILCVKSGGSVTIGPNIVVKVTEIYGDKVRLGIDAPKEIKIWRSELLEQVKEKQ